MRLRSEVVVVAASADGPGIAAPEDWIAGDSIINGANHGGSGAMALLEIAEYLAANRDSVRRSVLFLWTVGSEHGDPGAEWFAVNLSAMERVALAGAVVIGPIGRRRPGQGGRGDSVLDAGSLDDRLRCRGLHAQLTELGVPSVVVSAGDDGGYHSVNDDVARIDFAAYERLAKFVRASVLDLANGSRRPLPDSVRSQAGAGCAREAWR
jgi:Zn-dependent M28 family amino/carboxypeptidase